MSEKATNRSDGERQQAAPVISLPKGGGAIRGIGEKFAANPVTGTGSMTIPIYASPGRSGFGPQLSLSYDSGGGNGPFGFGWSLGLPAITRKTDKGLPQYRDSDESDIFILSGAEDLMPSLVQSGTEWVREVLPPRAAFGKTYNIRRYRPRVEGLFARIERWVNVADPQDTFWRSITRDNVSTWYGKTSESRIADPGDPSRIFSWLICESYDDKGNAIVYEYKREDSSGTDLDLAQAHERNRSVQSRSAKLYIKNIFYGNHKPYFPDLTLPKSLPSEWYFQLVFDYGEHDLENPAPQETTLWSARPDAFSTYRPTFEVRTYRLCRRILMFHHFAGESIGTNTLVRSTDLSHSDPHTAEATKPFYSFLLAATQTGYTRNSTGGYLSSSLPPVEFEYSQADVDETVREVDRESLENLPYGIDGTKYRWVDLDGEGVSGILTEQGGSWFYKPNTSPSNQQTLDGKQLTLPRFAGTELVGRQPSLATPARRGQQLMALSGHGQLDLVEFESPTPGFYERTPEEGWQPFQAFKSVPVVDWQNPNLKFIDLTGDGFPDLLISEDDAFCWHESLATDGFRSAQRVPQAFDEEKGPQLVFADGTESIFLADISGDSLTDLVRIRSGEICYWPNLGYGHFGPKVTMDNAPRFEPAGAFDGRRIHLADIDGSGTVDIIYFASDAIHLYFNQSGNSWCDKYALNNFPSVESLSSATAIDLLGNGTACLVWSSPLPGNARRPMRYIDLMGQKPHLLVRTANNLGAETRVQYAPSTKFYVQDKLAGTPWITRLPFPVHVVERVESYDWISRNRFVTSYSYHHGFYDGVEREFRGFGSVDQVDTEEFAALSGSSDFLETTNEDGSSHVPPVLTKTWFHTGAFSDESVISKHMQEEYYAEGDSSEAIAGLAPEQLQIMLLDDTVLPTTIRLPNAGRLDYDLSGEEMREACRALRGSVLRQEIYALDRGEESDRPYSAAEKNYTIEVLQPQGPNQFAAFFVHPREAVDFHYERKLYKVVGDALADPTKPVPPGALTAADPRVSHAVTLAVDTFGNVLQSVAIAYGRRYNDLGLTPDDGSRQTKTLSTYTENSCTNSILDQLDTYRTPLPAESSTYELLQFEPDASQPHLTHLFRFGELQAKTQAASDGHHDIPFENLNPTGLNANEPYRRLIGHARVLYRPDDMGAAAGDRYALLPLGKLEPLALEGASYKLAFTSGLIARVYQRNGATLLTNPADVLDSTLADGGAYVDVDKDGNQWVQSGRVFYADSPVSPQDEKTSAAGNFFLPRRFEDPFRQATVVDYDNYGLMAVKTTDAVLNASVATNDYRVLAPSVLTDPNGHQVAVSFDVLGMVAGSAVMDKTHTKGDSLDNFNPDLTATEVSDFYEAQDPHTIALDRLGNATTRVVYDLQRFVNSRALAPTDPTQWLPVFSATITRETHVKDLPPGQQTKTQISFSYSDGFGREIQKKIQAEPDPVDHPRWVGSGWTIFNNKGKPVRQYEPFFSQLAKGHQLEFGVTMGVSPILCYDPVERAVATLHPNNTYEKVIFNPWGQQNWDVNDNVLQTNLTADSDVGDFFERLPQDDYSPSWFALRTDPAFAAQAAQRWPDPQVRVQEASAAAKAAAHANTPAMAYFDTLGRPFLTIADNGPDGKYPAHVELDIQSFQRSVTDALGRKVMVYDYDMLGNRIHQSSMEAGERWMLHDVMGQSIRAWDSRGHNFRMEYDGLRRPTGLYVQGTDPANSDPRTMTPAEVLFQRIEYGEGQPDILNLRTRVFRTSDTAGVVASMGHNPNTNQDEGYDFKGNLLRNSRQFLEDHRALADWSGAPALMAETFTSSTQYDALNRPTATAAPDGSVFVPTYNEANFLETLSVNLRGAATATPFVTNIDYDAKGQRTLIEYGGATQTQTEYSYEPDTFRLKALITTRKGFPGNQQTVQDLTYTYDPVGNITHIQDNADIQNVIFFNNQRVEPSNDYIYDPIYRLIEAGGREQLGLGGSGHKLPPTASSYNDVPRIGLTPMPGDGNAVGLYVEKYHYDQAGNFLDLVHQGPNPGDPKWTRTYIYNEPSQLEPGKLSNRLTRTEVSGNQPLIENYSYDIHGNMTAMPQLRAMQLNFKNELLMTRRQAVNPSDDNGVQHQGERTFYAYDAGGKRVRKVTESSAGIKKKERFYLGGSEVYCEYDAGGTVTLQRETVHVMDDKQRVALIETRTQGNDGSPVQLIRYQFSNHLGSASLELDDQAQIISYEEYCPYGNTSYQAGRSAIEVALKRYRYTGMERDDESGLNYHGVRYYASWLGRWTSCDPLGIDAVYNLYAYSDGSPLSLVDISGLDTETPVLHYSPTFVKPDEDDPVEDFDEKTNTISLPPGKWFTPIMSRLEKHGDTPTAFESTLMNEFARSRIHDNTAEGRTEYQLITDTEERIVGYRLWKVDVENDQYKSTQFPFAGTSYYSAIFTREGKFVEGQRFSPNNGAAISVASPIDFIAGGIVAGATTKLLLGLAPRATTVAIGWAAGAGAGEALTGKTSGINPTRLIGGDFSVGRKLSVEDRVLSGVSAAAVLLPAAAAAIRNRYGYYGYLAFDEEFRPIKAGTSSQRLSSRLSQYARGTGQMNQEFRSRVWWVAQVTRRTSRYQSLLWETEQNFLNRDNPLWIASRIKTTAEMKGGLLFCEVCARERIDIRPDQFLLAPWRRD
jgi:RHS repeat-associated protein